MNASRKSKVFGACLCIAIPAVAAAQYNPGATSELGSNYGALNLSQGNLSLGQMDLSKPESGQHRPADRTASDAAVDAGIDRLVSHRVQSLAPEYNRQVRTTGTTAANQWLAAQVFSPEFRQQLDTLLAPGYARHLQQGGKPAANEWLAARGREIGYRAGIAAKALRQEAAH